MVPAVLGAGFLYLTWRIVTANGGVVQVDFLVGQLELVVWESLLGSFLTGAFLVGLFALYQMARGGLVARRYRRRLGDLEKEVHQLRNLPLHPELDPLDRVPGPQALAELEDGGPKGVRGAGA